MARWRREVKLEEPSEHPVTFRGLLVYIAGFALSNQLVRLDDLVKGHLFEPGRPLGQRSQDSGYRRGSAELHAIVLSPKCVYHARKRGSLPATTPS
jgi:hypothetical protein